MSSQRQNVVTVLLYVAQDLEDRQYAMAGVVRQVARQVATLALDEEAESSFRCRCGATVAQPRTGRPRKFCTSCSPQRKTAGKEQPVGEPVLNDQKECA